MGQAYLLAEPCERLLRHAGKAWWAIAIRNTLGPNISRRLEPIVRQRAYSEGAWVQYVVSLPASV